MGCEAAMLGSGPDASRERMPTHGAAMDMKPGRRVPMPLAIGSREQTLVAGT